MAGGSVRIWRLHPVWNPYNDNLDYHFYKVVVGYWPTDSRSNGARCRTTAAVRQLQSNFKSVGPRKSVFGVPAMSADESKSAESKSAPVEMVVSDVTQGEGRAVRLVQDNRSAVPNISAAESLRLIQAFTKIRDADDRMILIELAEQLAQKSR
jgi:hypothetical protein